MEQSLVPQFDFTHLSSIYFRHFRESGLVSKELLIGFLVSFCTSTTWVDSESKYVLRDSFISFEPSSNRAYYGVVEELQNSLYLHISCFVNFNSGLEKESVREFSISRFIVENLIANVKAYYPNVILATDHVYVLDVDRRLWEAQQSRFVIPVDIKIDEDALKRFTKIGVQSDYLDFEKFSGQQYDLNGAEFGKDFYTLVTNQWAKHVKDFQLNSDRAGFTDYLVGRLKNWVGRGISDKTTNFNVLKEEQPSDHCSAYRIRYDIPKAFSGKIFKYLTLRTVVNVHDARNPCTSSVCKSSVAQTSTTYDIFNDRMEADNVQVINFKLSEDSILSTPQITFTRSKLLKTDIPLAYRILTDVDGIVLAREIADFPVILDKDEHVDYFAAYLHGKFAIKSESIVYSIPTDMCRNLGIGDYLYVIITPLYHNYVISISKNKVNYAALIKYVEQRFTSLAYICSIRKFDKKTLRQSTSSILNDPTSQNIFFIRGGRYVVDYLKTFESSRTSLLHRLYKRFNTVSFVELPTFSMENYAFENSAEKQSENLDIIINQIYGMSQNILGIDNGITLSFVVQGALEGTYYGVHRPYQVSRRLKFEMGDKKNGRSKMVEKHIYCPIKEDSNIFADEKSKGIVEYRFYNKDTICNAFK